MTKKANNFYDNARKSSPSSPFLTDRLHDLQTGLNPRDVSETDVNDVNDELHFQSSFSNFYR